mgnify:CR=1 FL=1
MLDDAHTLSEEDRKSRTIEEVVPEDETDIIISDELNHACIIDSIRLATTIKKGLHKAVYTNNKLEGERSLHAALEAAGVRRHRRHHPTPRCPLGIAGGLPRHLAEWIATLGLSKFQLILALTVFYVVLGCFLDGISMVVLTMAVLLPTVQKAGFDLIWFGIFVVLVVELAQITPPVGFNLFVLQGLTRRDITWIAQRSMPLFFLMLAFVLLLWFVPGIATWMPARM